MDKNYFALGLVRVRLLFFVLIRVRQKLQLSYAIEKREREFLSYSFSLLLRIRKHSPFFKILQLVHTRNRPIQQLSVQFLVESNSHRYESREWTPGL